MGHSITRRQPGETPLCTEQATNVLFVTDDGDLYLLLLCAAHFREVSEGVNRSEGTTR